MNSSMTFNQAMLSLVFDYVDVVRYLLGERESMIQRQSLGLVSTNRPSAATLRHSQ